MRERVKRYNIKFWSETFLKELDRISKRIPIHKTKRITPNTISSPEELLREIDKIRIQGYAVDNEELSIGLKCIAAPVIDYAGNPSYAMSISGPTQRMSEERIQFMQEKLLSVCRRFSRQAGAPVK